MALHCLLRYLTDVKLFSLQKDPETWVDRVDKCKHIVDIVISKRTVEAEVEDEIVNECRSDRRDLIHIHVLVLG